MNKNDGFVAFCAIGTVLLISLCVIFYQMAAFYKVECLRLKNTAIERGCAEMVELDGGQQGFRWIDK